MPPQPCPFWSEKAQTEHNLDQMRPRELTAEEAPVPDDVEWSPKAVQDMPSGSRSEERDQGVFETPEHPREAPGVEEQDVPERAQPEGELEEAERKVESSWRRRAHGRGKPSHAETAHEEPRDDLERALEASLVDHLQRETVMLQDRNDMLERELLKMKAEREAMKVPIVPPSWNHVATERQPSPPPRRDPGSAQSQYVWCSPETFQATPNGTRVPPGPPPMSPSVPDPPPLPAWPDLSQYEVLNEPPRKYRGVMTDNSYRLGTPADRTKPEHVSWLEHEVSRLQELLDQQYGGSGIGNGYWNTPFLTEAQKARELQMSVERLRRNAGISTSSGADACSAPCEPCDGRACEQQRSSAPGVFGGNRAQQWQHDLGELHGRGRALNWRAVHGDVCHDDRAFSAQHELGGQGLRGRSAGNEQVLGEVCHQPRTSRMRSPSRGDPIEDGDLKSVPITLPALPAPDGREASLDAGDWMIQLEPLIGDLSRNASVWWKGTMEVISERYAIWLHADPLTRLKIVAPLPRELPAGFERLDQRVTSLLLQAVPACIKDEVIATRELHTAGILYRIFRTYQPGGLNEKSRLLEDMTTVPGIKSVTEMVAALRLWKRKASRALELQAQLPDPLLLIRTLDGISKTLDGCANTSFRIATFRMTHALDTKPTMTNVWLYYDLLLAESEAMMHAVSATMDVKTSAAKTALKQMNATPSPGKTPDATSPGTRPCKFWLTDAGCRQGQRCRWLHSWDNATDKSARCWTCSSIQHLQQDCPTKTQAKTPVGGEGDGKQQDGRKEKGGGKGKQQKKGKGEGKSSPPAKEHGNDEKKDEVKETAAGNEPTSSTATSGEKKPETGGSGNNAAELLQEATKLLKSLNVPSIKAISLKEVTSHNGGHGDQILIDSGATHALRRAKDWNEWSQAEETVVALAQGTTNQLRLKPGTLTLLTNPTDGSFGNGILPMGSLASLGFEVLWIGGDCKLQGPDGECIRAQVVNGCPMIDHHKGMKLIELMERESQRLVVKEAMVRALIQQPQLMSELEEIDPAVLLTVLMKKEFPSIPEAISSRVVPTLKDVQGSELPWNRRRRRQIAKAKRVILHLFSGPDVKTWSKLEKDGTVVVCIDKSLDPKMDLLGGSLMSFLLQLASSGRVVAIVGGPPCRTVSACRYQKDSGPPPLRSECEPYGLESLTFQQAQQVHDDTVLLCRMKLLYMVAQHCKPAQVPKVLFGMEQPQDPQEYRSTEDVAVHGYMSVFRTEAWQHFQQQYHLQRCNFEQGAFGHLKVKPTTFAHCIDGVQDLDGAKAPRGHGSDDNWKHLPMEERMKLSSTWAEWAPGFKAALCEAIQRYLDKLNHGEGNSISPRDQPRLCPLTEVALQKWKLHIENDHQPMRRDCRQCMEAAGRSRPHKRLQHPSAYCLSLDLSGRLHKGKDQFGQSHKYFMVGCFTFPTTKDDLPLVGPGFDGDPQDVPLPTLEESMTEDGLAEDYEDFELPPLEEDQEEAVNQDEGDQQACETAKTSYDNWMRLIDHCKDVKVKTLTFVELLPSRQKGHVLEAISKIYAKVRSLGLEVLRIHADRAREFTSKAVQQWCYERGVVATYTTGSDWKANGRAENEVGVVKRHARVLMKVHGCDEAQWPLLIRHAGERRLRWQLNQVGFPVPALLPFGTKVLVKRKSWNGRYAAWRWDRVEGRIVGPDPWSSLTSGGYCVQLTDNGRYVPSSDVIVQHPGMHEDVVRMVVERQEDVPPDDAPLHVPRRRLRGKQTVPPQVAAMELIVNSGEDVEEQKDQEFNEQSNEKEHDRLLKLHGSVTTVLSEECKLINDMDPLQMNLIPSLSMLAHQKYDLEVQMRALDVERRRNAEEENFLVTKTIQADQVYKEWESWTPAMRSEYESLVHEKRAVRQMTREQAKALARDQDVVYEELPSKVVFTRKSGGKYKVRACVCGNFEGPVSASTYAGGCDASQIRVLVRHGALKAWKTFSTDIKCAFLNAPRQDKSKLVCMTVPSIYVRLGLAAQGEVWVIDSAVYGLTTSPRDWSDHRDREVPAIKWSRIEREASVSVKDEGGGRTCQFDRCYRKLPDSGSDATEPEGKAAEPVKGVAKTWSGSFVPAEDQHLWHLIETCLETGEERAVGAMAIYVDDVLMSAEEASAEAALKAIAGVWECTAPEKATLEKAITFCGFEIQENEAQYGGGYRLHQRKYEEELMKRWEITGVASQPHFKLPMPEDEALMQKSEDEDAVRKAQACTGALLWLATRTRPEISVAVAAMSRLCMKAPEIALEIGLKTMEYLNKPSRGMIYANHPGPQFGARDQLSKPRDETTIEAFSDISYASTSGYRSVQGQVYYYAGAPVMWNTNRQPFPIHSQLQRASWYLYVKALLVVALLQPWWHRFADRMLRCSPNDFGATM